MSEEMAAEFKAAVDELKSDSGVRVLILRGAGKAFSAGGDLEMLHAKTKLSAEVNQQKMEWFYQQFLSITELNVPIIAAINGHAVGAGLCVALACDIRIAKSGAKLGLNFVRLGLHPGMGVTYFLPRVVGPARAAELLYTGSIISADAAKKIGLVHDSVSEDSFEERVAACASEIAFAGPQAVRALKVSLRQSETRDLQACLVREAEAQAQDYIGPEFLEGITAAKEKRKPNF